MAQILDLITGLTILWTVFILSIWIFCGVASVMAAKSKRRERFAWFGAGLAFGPLALLALAAMGPKGVQCGGCREIVSPGADVCPHCGTERP